MDSDYKEVSLEWLQKNQKAVLSIGDHYPLRTNYEYENSFGASGFCRKIYSVKKEFRTSNSPFSNHLEISNTAKYLNAKLQISTADHDVIINYRVC